MPTWDAEAGSDYLTGTNWDGDVAPAPGDAVVIDNGSLVDQPILGAGDSSVVDTVSVIGGSLTVNGNLSATTGVTISATGLLSVGAAGSISGNAIVQIGGTLTLDGALIGNIANDDTLTINASSQIVGSVSSSGTGSNSGVINVDLDVTAGSFTNSGTVSGNSSVSDSLLVLALGSNLSDTGQSRWPAAGPCRWTPQIRWEASVRPAERSPAQRC